MISFEIHQGIEAVERYQTEWDELIATGRFEPSASVEWTRALLKTHFRDGAFYVIVFKDSKELLGILPLVVVTKRRYGFSYSSASPVSEYYNTHSDLLLNISSEEIGEALTNALARLGTCWDLFRISRFAESNPRLLALERYLKRSRTKHALQQEQPSYFIRLGTSFDDYIGKRSKNLRSNLRRQEKLIHTLGRVEYCKAEDCANIADAYQKVLFIEENSWKHREGTAITCVPAQREFYRELCETLLKKGSLCLRFLELNGVPIAYEMGLVNQTKFFSLKASYHEQHRKPGPSTLLLTWLLKELIQTGREEYDFSAEPYDWEKHWTDDLRQHTSLIIYNNTVKATFFSWYNTVKILSSPSRLNHANKRSNDPTNQEENI